MIYDLFNQTKVDEHLGGFWVFCIALVLVYHTRFAALCIIHFENASLFTHVHIYPRRDT